MSTRVKPRVFAVRISYDDRTRTQGASLQIDGSLVVSVAQSKGHSAGWDALKAELERLGFRIVPSVGPHR